ncbi:hypothetical protein E0H46_28775 [Rhizobium leguminosarum bv. viciae]|nr:hypothetical protein E0H46_28775 [Rhizobium leguminosarum bv. viciae]
MALLALPLSIFLLFAVFAGPKLTAEWFRPKNITQFVENRDGLNVGLVFSENVPLGTRKDLVGGLKWLVSLGHLEGSQRLGVALGFDGEIDGIDVARWILGRFRLVYDMKDCPVAGYFVAFLGDAGQVYKRRPSDLVIGCPKSPKPRAAGSVEVNLTSLGWHAALPELQQLDAYLLDERLIVIPASALDDEVKTYPFLSIAQFPFTSFSRRINPSLQEVETIEKVKVIATAVHEGVHRGSIAAHQQCPKNSYQRVSRFTTAVVLDQCDPASLEYAYPLMSELLYVIAQNCTCTELEIAFIADQSASGWGQSFTNWTGVNLKGKALDAGPPKRYFEARKIVAEAMASFLQEGGEFTGNRNQEISLYQKDASGHSEFAEAISRAIKNDEVRERWAHPNGKAGMMDVASEAEVTAYLEAVQEPDWQVNLKWAIPMR